MNETITVRGSDSVKDYGWESEEETCSGPYISGSVLAVLSRLHVRRVLDLGSGNGALCRQLSAAGFEVVGVERDAKGVEIARQASPKSIRYFRLGVEDDPSPLLAEEPPFEAVVSTEVIEHLFDPQRLPAFAARTLTPAGYLLVTTPYHGYLKNLALALLDKWDHHHTPLWLGGHIKFFSRRTLTQLLENGGFRAIDFVGLGRVPYLWKSMMLVAQKVPGHAG